MSPGTAHFLWFLLKLIDISYDFENEQSPISIIAMLCGLEKAPGLPSAKGGKTGSYTFEV